MADNNWITLATLLLGNGTAVAVLVGGLLQRRKTRSEAGKTDAEADKVDAETTEALVRTSLSLLQPYTEGLARFGAEAARLRDENTALINERVDHGRREEALRIEIADLRKVNRLLEKQIGVLQGRLDVLLGHPITEDEETA